MVKPKFNARDEASRLAAKYITHRTDSLTQWRTLYDFAEDLLERGYLAGKAEAKAESRAASRALAIKALGRMVR